MSALVPWRPEEGAMIPSAGKRLSSYDLATPEGRRGQYRATVGSDWQLDDLQGQSIEVSHFMLHWVEDTAEDGAEPKLRPRAVLIAPDGTRISTGSLSAIRCVMEAAVIAQASPPWKPALKFTVRAEKRREGPGHWLWLDWEV